MTKLIQQQLQDLNRQQNTQNTRPTTQAEHSTNNTQDQQQPNHQDQQDDSRRGNSKGNISPPPAPRKRKRLFGKAFSSDPDGDGPESRSISKGPTYRGRVNNQGRTIFAQPTREPFNRPHTGHEMIQQSLDPLAIIIAIANLWAAPTHIPTMTIRNLATGENSIIQRKIALAIFEFLGIGLGNRLQDTKEAIGLQMAHVTRRGSAHTPITARQAFRRSLERNKGIRMLAQPEGCDTRDL